MQSPSLPDTASAVLDLPDETATDALGAGLAGALRAGDILLLSGPVGSGKTHLARALLRARFGPATEVPSPTYTLVQTYGDATGTVWHADLYRLGSADELLELGLEAAFGRDICLVEWPERLGRAVPPGALHLALTPQGEGRRATLRGGRPEMIAALVRTVPDA